MRIVIVGGGIVGLAHAWSAVRRGSRVLVCERSPRAQGASVRNFGMIWPIGQPNGELRQVALRSREAWIELANSAGVWLNPCGSLHVAHRDDEWAVLEEFHELAQTRGIECRLCTPVESSRLCPGVRCDSLLGGLFSPTELCVDPRTALVRLAAWLAERYAVEFRYGTTAVANDGRGLLTANGERLPFDHLLVCGGADFETLYPAEFRHAGLRRCKLQMLATPPQPNAWRLGAHLAGGLTLRHYANFAECPSLPGLRERIAAETPELDHYGIHVMASQNHLGEVILGDSHEYDDPHSPFYSTSIDDLILRELAKILVLPEWRIDRRWHGVYAKHNLQPQFIANPSPDVTICTGTGGAGMTMAFGLAEQLWEQAKWGPI